MSMTPAIYERLLKSSSRELISRISGNGGTVIEDGGTLSGVYSSSVFCHGDVSIQGEVTVKGDLIVLGGVTNNGGYLVTVSGDFYAQNVDFSKLDTSTPQSDIVVGGDMNVRSLTYPQSGVQAAAVRVSGSLTSRNLISANGVDGDTGTDGALLEIGGNLVCDGIQIRGGSATAGNAGNGGGLTAVGTITLSDDMDASGGDAIDGDAGNGGSLQAQGDVNSGFTSIRIAGGSAQNGNAGNGGSVSVDGNFSVNSLDMFGGSCISNNSSHRAGSGGEITIDGSLTANSSVDLDAGYREGTLVEPGSANPAHGGRLSVYGHVVIDEDIDADGGGVATGEFSACSGGNGGEVYVTGDLIVRGSIDMGGGDSQSNADGPGGSGGTIQVGGRALFDDGVYLGGGDSEGGNGGSGGQIFIESDLKTGSIYFDGGYGVTGNGGAGGSLTVQGALYLQSSASGYGGNSNSLNETHFAGSGGSLSCKVLNADDSAVDLRGGGRYGSTTVSATGNPPANGGSLIIVEGSAIVDSIYLLGGGVDTDYPNSPGGNGGSLEIYGGLICRSWIDCGGGSSRGNTGGMEVRF